MSANYDIKDFIGYNEKMNATLFDKLFWAERIKYPVSQLIDIGCATGTLLRAYRAMSPNTELIGIEESLDMKRQLKKNLENKKYKIKVYSELEEMPAACKPGAVINMSSVLHEVYSYKNEGYIQKFWKQINEKAPEYITIRDMLFDDDCNINLDFDIPKAKEAILKSVYSGFFMQFENRWGPVKTNKQMIHFLLKYRYAANWNRELNENYFACTFEDIMTQLHKNYEIIYRSEFILPWTAQCAYADFGLTNLPNNTHQKLIFQKI